MAWIESHTSLEKHPKLIRLQTAMRWSRNETVGFLHRFWWMVLEVSPSGDVTALSSPEVMSETLNMKVDLVGEALEQMEKVGLLDRTGDGKLIVHGWLDYAGIYLSTSKFKRFPERMAEIRAVHGLSKDNPGTVRDTKPTEPNQPDQPTKTKPPLPPPGDWWLAEIPDDLRGNEAEIRDWMAYKREKGQKYKPTGLGAFWRALRAIPPEKRRESVDWSMANNWSGLFQKRENTGGFSRKVTGEAGHVSGKYDHVSR